jgi:hypothetical protein
LAAPEARDFSLFEFASLGTAGICELFRRLLLRRLHKGRPFHTTMGCINSFDDCLVFRLPTKGIESRNDP